MGAVGTCTIDSRARSSTKSLRPATTATTAKIVAAVIQPSRRPKTSDARAMQG
jgi:hypothetical protein